MSYHLPYRGLPQELLDIIYEHALIRERIPIGKNVQPSDRNESCFMSLLQTSRKTHEDIISIIYGNNTFEFSDSFKDVLLFLKTLSQRSLLAIRHVSFTSESLHARPQRGDKAEQLCRLLTRTMKLRTLTIAGPSPHNLGGLAPAWDVLREEFYDWTFVAMLGDKVLKGHLETLRICHYTKLSHQTVGSETVFVQEPETPQLRHPEELLIVRFLENSPDFNREVHQATRYHFNTRIVNYEKEFSRVKKFVVEYGRLRRVESGFVVMVRRNHESAMRSYGNKSPLRTRRPKPSRRRS
ncbi:hypothetical protein K432DRAFT_386364 [Lepidopterella palustris CBS 459.81]|uniref:Uncharacterized protein n=1 Tax=Lepidopterella palustris CBS 459.81 TaxID=1314670 RepID=A0A8E2JAD4_9PEZI|nr:hypothetical protein K432DRAFT_386364 [Lepidopterella palustris CBS 459.81]